MALATCQDCGQSVSNAAKACPSCGRPTPQAQSNQAWLLAPVVGVGALALFLLLVWYLSNA